jgi:hypothetical protein
VIASASDLSLSVILGTEAAVGGCGWLGGWVVPGCARVVEQQANTMAHTVLRFMNHLNMGT